jgi:molybdopterin molybdotransferase
MAEPDVSDLISVQQAMAIIDAAAVRPLVRRVGLGQASGLYLAEDLRSDRDAPPFDKSVMDGFAVRAQDTGLPSCELEIVGQVAAGGSGDISLKGGQAISIMTGAPLPAGADAVVPVEQTRIGGGSSRIAILEPAKEGQFIARRGSEYSAGAMMLKSGVRLGPAQIAVAASIGAATPAVYAPPTVAVLGTGDELVGPAEIPGPSQIRSCNNPMLLALLGRYPVRMVNLGLVVDDRAKIETKISAAMEHDVLLVTGGMSMGERDYVPGILKELGADLKITKLRIKPGKPFVFAKMPGGKFVFGLPGNPVSAFVCTRILVSRLLMRMAGGPASPAVQKAPLAKPLEKSGPRAFYQPAIFDGSALTPLDWRGSADIHTLSRANCLLVRPENHPAQPAGAAIEFVEF